MKQKLTSLLILLMSMFAFGGYQVGDVVANQSWTDSNGESHTIYDLVDAGKVVVFFWGTTG
ncbi:MAG: hypothetical protein JXR48_08590 [Candidatus Delongbacteria bacterium]|nr:hypothetical protein [Candidatus Delongbacteria bacterium]MBN2835010.1 hypothetical protein [Candidatus Delongbacteria bacterium]